MRLTMFLLEKRAEKSYKRYIERYLESESMVTKNKRVKRAFAFKYVLFDLKHPSKFKGWRWH